MKDRSDASSLSSTFNSFRSNPVKFADCLVQRPTGINPMRMKDKPWNKEVLEDIYDEFGEDSGTYSPLQVGP
jgi:hypothetical protein